MFHEIKAQGSAEPLGGDEALDPAEDFCLAGPVLVVDLHGAAGIGGVQLDPSVLSDHVPSPFISLKFCNFADVSINCIVCVLKSMRNFAIKL